MRQVCLAAAALLILCGPPRATADEGPDDCLGIDFNLAHPIGIAKIIADRPRVYFVKSAFEDAACPADGDACLQQTPFDKTSDDKGSCLVRMQLIEKLLVAENNGSCGGAMVTFTGFYRSK